MLYHGAKMKKSTITQEYLRERLDYNPETGEFTWKRRPTTNARHNAWNAKHAGTQAGYIQTNGYRYIGLDGRVIQAHRLAYLYMTGSLPPESTDHINGVRSDNRWNNLRLATHQENMWNRRPRAGTSSVFKGITWDTRINKWAAQIRIDGKQKHLGSYHSEYEAHLAYERAASQIQGEFQFRGAA